MALDKKKVLSIFDSTAPLPERKKDTPTEPPIPPLAPTPASWPTPPVRPQPQRLAFPGKHKGDRTITVAVTSDQVAALGQLENQIEALRRQRTPRITKSKILNVLVDLLLERLGDETSDLEEILGEVEDEVDLRSRLRRLLGDFPKDQASH